jgi:hypothetical protein
MDFSIMRVKILPLISFAAISLVSKVFANLEALLYRVENNIVFEELKARDKAQGSLATVLEKDSKPYLSSIYLGNYWIYHKSVIEE